MVLTNFECWAHGGGAVVGNDGLPLDSRHVDMFNPRMVQQRLNTATGASPVSHISSNGYYGFSYVNATHEAVADNGHSHNDSNAAAVTQNTNNTNINNNNNNNNNNRCVPNANDVNGMPMMHTNMDVGVGTVDGAAAAFDNGFSAPHRCKKRYFVSDDDYANCALLNDVGAGVTVAGLDVCAAKRCRFDDDYAAAQYCNDFFSLPSTQIGTQSCLMDTEDTQQQLQLQVDVNMGAANITNQTSNTTSNIHFITQQQQQHAQQQQREQQQQVINAAQAPPVVVYQQQHNYQAKRRRQAIDCDASHGNSIVNVYHNNNINTANQNNSNNNNNAFFNNNHEIKRLASSAAMHNSMGCGRRESGIDSSENSGAFAEGERGGANGVDNTTFEVNQAKFPAFTIGQKAAVVGNSLVEDSKEDNSGVSTLYAKTHGGAFYQFTAASAGNQPYMDDI